MHYKRNKKKKKTCTAMESHFMEKRLQALEERVAVLERERKLHVPEDVQCTSECVDDGDAVLVTKGDNDAKFGPLQEFVDLFLQSPLRALTQNGVLYLALWPHFGPIDAKLDISIPPVLKLHTAAIVSLLGEKGFSAAFHKLSRCNKLSTLHCCYYRVDRLGYKTIYSYPRNVDGSTVPNSKSYLTLAIWAGT